MDIMSISELAALVGRHPMTIRNLEARGVIPKAKRSSGRRYYTVSDYQQIRAILYPDEPPVEEAS